MNKFILFIVFVFTSFFISACQSTTPSSVVPLPQDQDIIRNFFQLIEDGQAADAVSYLSTKNTTDDSTKQAWAVQFNAINSVKVTAIEPSNQSDWTDTGHQYRVQLDVVMDPNSADAPIPYYGYDYGDNTRFINLIKQGDLWLIDSIATGP